MFHTSSYVRHLCKAFFQWQPRGCGGGVVDETPGNSWPGTVANERQLTGIVNLDDGFQAASSPDRLSTLDPLPTVDTTEGGQLIRWCIALAGRRCGEHGGIEFMDCWMCGAPADTGEHKIKKSLLVELHGSGAYTGANAMSHVKDGEVRNLQGPGSELVKYRKCLCRAMSHSLLNGVG